MVNGSEDLNNMCYLYFCSFLRLSVFVKQISYLEVYFKYYISLYWFYLSEPCKLLGSVLIYFATAPRHL